MDSETWTLEDVIRELDGGLRELYGARHRGLVLYGSHARGEADEGSDVDLLFQLRQAADYSAAPEAVSEEDAEHTIREGKAFLAAAREYLERR